MTAANVLLSPLPKLRFTDNNGNPLSGGKLFTYIAGTTTKQNTYTDSTGNTANTNPIILDSRGECNCWLDDTLSYKLTLSPSTDTDPPTNAFWTVDGIQGLLAALASLTVTFATGLIVIDSTFKIEDNADNTKILQFQLSGLTAGTTRILTAPDGNLTIVGANADIRLSGTAGTTITTPSTSSTMARTDAGQTFTGQQVVNSSVNGYDLTLNNSNASGAGGVLISYSTDFNGTGNEAFYFQGNGTLRASIRSNGGLANFSGNNANLSDVRTKKEIKDVGSFYDAWRRLRIRSFLYKDQSDDVPTIGVVAQELETEIPELIDSGGWGQREIQQVENGQPVFAVEPVLDEHGVSLLQVVKTGVIDAQGIAITREETVTNRVPVMIENPDFAPDGVPLKAVYDTDFMYTMARVLQETQEKLESVIADFAAYKAAHP